MKPRTVWGCQSVARMISVTLAPLERSSSRMTCAFLVPARTVTLFDRAPFLRRGLLFAAEWPDRKSTRLNSSHSQISYAVFCVKKKDTPEQAVKKERPPAKKRAVATVLAQPIPQPCCTKSENLDCRLASVQVPVTQLANVALIT